MLRRKRINQFVLAIFNDIFVNSKKSHNKISSVVVLLLSLFYLLICRLLVFDRRDNYDIVANYRVISHQMDLPRKVEKTELVWKC